VRNISYIIIICIVFFSLYIYFQDPNKQANELFVEAFNLMEMVKNGSGNYSELLEKYKNAKEKTNLIISDYTSSNIAVSLISGDKKIAGLSLSEIKEIEKPLTEMAEIESNLFAASIYFAKYSKYKSEYNDSRYDLKYKTTLAFIEIAKQFSDVKKYDYALKALNLIDIDSDEEKYQVKKNIVDIYLNSDRLSDALNVALKLNIVYKLRLNMNIAEKYAELGQNKKANEIISIAIEDIKNISDITLNIMLMNYIVGALVSIESKKEIAMQMLSKQLKKVEAMGESPSVDRGLMLMSVDASLSVRLILLGMIAKNYVKIDENKKASEILSSALITAKKMKDKADQARKLLNIAIQYSKAGEKKISINVLLLAFNAAKTGKTSGNIERTIHTLLKITDEFSKLLEQKIAFKVLSYVLNSIESDLHSKHSKIPLIAKTAISYANAGNKDKSMELLSNSLQLTLSDDVSKYYKSQLIISIAEAYSKINEGSEAIKALNTALSLFVTNDLDYYHEAALILSGLACNNLNLKIKSKNSNINNISTMLKRTNPLKKYWK